MAQNPEENSNEDANLAAHYADAQATVGLSQHVYRPLWSPVLGQQHRRLRCVGVRYSHTVGRVYFLTSTCRPQEFASPQ